MELTDKPNPNGVKTDPKAFEIAKQLINAGKNWGKGGDNIDMYSGAELIRDFAEQYAQEKVKEALKITKVDHVCYKCGKEILNNS